MQHIFVFHVTYRDKGIEYFNIRETDLLAAWMSVVIAAGRDARAIEFSHVQEPSAE